MKASTVLDILDLDLTLLYKVKAILKMINNNNESMYSFAFDKWADSEKMNQNKFL